jgi:Fur family ferric uptake transcriptional regulator
MTDSTILTALKKNGHRITTARKSIIEAMLTMQKPCSALEMHAVLSEKGLTTNKVTVYRELGFLEREGVVHDVTFNDGVKRYELASEAHRHHLICTECKAIQDVEMDHDLDGIERKIRKEKSFTVRSHSLEFYGLCARCA